jgi:hypothetical protein
MYKKLMLSTLFFSIQAYSAAKLGEQVDTMTEKVNGITEHTSLGALGTTNPPHIQGKGWFFDIDGLCWKAEQEGLDFAIKNTGSNGDDFKTKDENPNSDWRAGFHIGTGYQFGQDAWDLSLYLTTFYGTADRTTHADRFNSFLTPTWGGPFFTLPGIKASSKWNLHYNVIDLALGRTYFLSKRVAARFQIGVREAWIYQNYSAHYSGQITTRSLPTLSIVNADVLVNTDPRTAAMKAHNDFQGSGIRLGTDLLWHFSSQFYLFGKLSGSFLYGEIDVDQTYKAQVINRRSFIATDTTMKNDKNYRRLKTNLEGTLGIEWEYMSKDRHKCYAVAFAYDFVKWFRQNYLVRSQFSVQNTFGLFAESISQTERGDLSLEGFNLSLRMDF